MSDPIESENQAGGVNAAQRPRRPSTALYGLTPEVEKAVEEALEEDRLDDLRNLLKPLHPADFADLLERQDTEERQQLIAAGGEDLDPEFLVHLDESVREDVVEFLDDRNLAEVLIELDSDDALEVIEDLDEALQARLLRALPARDRAFVEEGLTFPEDSAGRLMQREIVAIPTHWTVGQTIDFLRTYRDLPDDFYDIFVVDPMHKPVGSLALSHLLRRQRPVRVSDIMIKEFHEIPAEMEQEEVALLFRQYGIVSAPVVDGDRRLLGMITLDDVVDVIDEEAEEDLMYLAGVSETDIYSDLRSTVKSRFSWLAVNLVTAIIASMVIGAFQDTIEQIVALAVLMPIVASMGGNAGTQTLTVAVRALAMRELYPGNAIKFIIRESAVGWINGMAFAAVAAGVSYLWFGDIGIAAIMGLAMIVNLMVAAVFGALIPLGLERFDIDPAVASGVFMTTVTDVIGFLTFLGFAAMLLL